MRRNRIMRTIAFAAVGAVVAASAIVGAAWNAAGSGATNASASAFACSAECMIVVERDSGRVLGEKNAHKRVPMASTTKIATAITVIERCADLDRKIKVPASAAGVEGSSIYLKAGEEISIRDLLYGLMLRSGNDCATALAITTGGSVPAFADMMNATAAKVGATDTHFVNPHGLHDDEHYTTAADLAAITAYAMKNETFREIVASKRHTAARAGGDEVMVNKNKILTTYEGGDGVKTGYTKKAGRCLVASATRGGMCVIAVVLNCGPMFEDCRALLDEAFSTYERCDIAKLSAEAGLCASVEGGKTDHAALRMEGAAYYPLAKDERERVTFELVGAKKMRAPVRIGDENGKIRAFLGERLLFERKSYTIEEVEPLSPSDSLRDIAGRRND